MQDQLSFGNIIKLNAAELDEQLETVLTFLRLVHPSLISDEKSKPCVELRPIVRGTRDYNLSRPCNIWDLSDESIERVRAFLKKHNGAPTCLFYSIYTYDNNMKVNTKKGTVAKPGHITSASAIYTHEIVLDFDHIGFEEYTKLVDRFEAMGLYALWVFTGHGYHAHLLLSEGAMQKDILAQVVYKFRSKGFDCDSACVDAARVMRLPGTYNKKYLVDETYAFEGAEPPKCAITQASATRYSIGYIIDALDKLPTVSRQDEEIFFEKIGNVSPAVLSEAAGNAGISEDENLNLLRQVEYPYISEYDLPLAIQRILACTPQGFRNRSLGFLINFFKNYFKLGKTQLEAVLTIWAKEACVPAYSEKEFEEDFARLYYNYNGLNYTAVMVEKFGEIDFGQLVELRKKDIRIPNKFFRAFQDLEVQEVRVYLGLKMLEHQGTIATQANLAELLNISTRALRPAIQSLEKSGFAYRMDGNRRLGIPYSYRTSKLISQTDGYMVFSYNDIKAYISELFDEGNRLSGALKLYLFFRYKFWSGQIYMSQENLGESIGVDQSSISRMVDRLEELHFINVQKVRRSFMESCVYTLLR